MAEMGQGRADKFRDQPAEMPTEQGPLALYTRARGRPRRNGSRTRSRRNTTTAFVDCEGARYPLSELGRPREAGAACWCMATARMRTGGTSSRLT